MLWSILCDDVIKLGSFSVLLKVAAPLPRFPLALSQQAPFTNVDVCPWEGAQAQAPTPSEHLLGIQFSPAALFMMAFAGAGTGSCL